MVALFVMVMLIVRVMGMATWLRLICTASATVPFYLITNDAGVSAGAASVGFLAIVVPIDFIGCCIDNWLRRRFMERKCCMAMELEAAMPDSRQDLTKST